MKKTISMLLVLSALLTAPAAMAENMGVQVIGGPTEETEPVSLDDLKLNTEVEVEGYAILCATEFVYKDDLGHYGKGESRPGEAYYKSGEEADYAMLRMDITNLALTPHDFLSACEVKVVYDDVYEYGGWCYQYNYNNYTRRYTEAGWSYGDDTEKQNTNWVINEADQFAIDPMYQGHYVFGCTLPNAIVQSKKPLKMIITIDGNEITYYVRK